MRWAFLLIVLGLAAAWGPVVVGWSDLPDIVPLALVAIGAGVGVFVWAKAKTFLQLVGALTCLGIAVGLGAWLFGLSAYGAVEGTPGVGSRAPEIAPIRVRDGAKFHLTAQRKDDVLLVFFRGAW